MDSYLKVREFVLDFLSRRSMLFVPYVPYCDRKYRLFSVKEFFENKNHFFSKRRKAKAFLNKLKKTNHKGLIFCEYKKRTIKTEIYPPAEIEKINVRAVKVSEMLGADYGNT